MKEQNHLLTAFLINSWLLNLTQKIGNPILGQMRQTMSQSPMIVGIQSKTPNYHPRMKTQYMTFAWNLLFLCPSLSLDRDKRANIRECYTMAFVQYINVTIPLTAVTTQCRKFTIYLPRPESAVTIIFNCKGSGMCSEKIARWC